MSGAEGPAAGAVAPPDEGYVRVARAPDVTPGVPLAVATPDGAALVLVRVDGAICALADQCTHREFPLSAGEVLPDGTIECPWHGARFDCRTGAVRNGPARDAVAVRETRLVDGDVWVRTN